MWYNVSHYPALLHLSVLFKLFEKSYSHWLWKYTKSLNNPFPHPYQHGFPVGLGCTTASYVLQQTIDYNVAAENDIHAVLLDIKSAFDTVHHDDALFIKIYEMGVKGKLWRVIAKSYQNIESVVILNWSLIPLVPCQIKH